MIGLAKTILKIKVHAEGETSYSLESREIYHTSSVVLRLGDTVLDEISSGETRIFVLELDLNSDSAINFDASFQIVQGIEIV